MKSEGNTMKSKFFRKPSASEVIAGIVAFSLFAVPLALHLFVAAALPETMVGEAGLRQTRAYLLRFVGVEILRIGITLAVVIVYLRSLHWQYKEKQVREKPAVIVISLIFILGMSLIWTPKSSRVDVQGERNNSRNDLGCRRFPKKFRFHGVSLAFHFPASSVIQSISTSTMYACSCAVRIFPAGM